MLTMIRVFQGNAVSGDDGWANDAFYAIQRSGLDVREGVDNCTSWDECSGTEDSEEYVTMRVPEEDTGDVIKTLEANGYRATTEAPESSSPMWRDEDYDQHGDAPVKA